MNNSGADRRGVSSPVPCSGAERKNKVLDEVSTALHGGEAAVQAEHLNLLSPKTTTMPPTK